MRRFVELRAGLPSFGPALDRAVTDHLDGVANAVRATVDWTLESTRYGGGGRLVEAAAGGGTPS